MRAVPIMVRRTIGIAFAGVLVAFGVAPPAAAHGFGQRYDLPLPLSLYLFGAAAVVVLSFLVFALFVRRAGDGGRYQQVDLLTTRRVNNHDIEKLCTGPFQALSNDFDSTSINRRIEGWNANTLG